MKVVVFGATGGTGRCITQQALELGLNITAFARTPSKVTLVHPNLRVFDGAVTHTHKKFKARNRGGRPEASGAEVVLEGDAARGEVASASAKRPQRADGCAARGQADNQRSGRRFLHVVPFLLVGLFTGVAARSSSS